MCLYDLFATCIKSLACSSGVPAEADLDSESQEPYPVLFAGRMSLQD
jgi:hypothetical protein